jgi:hypothetical protein
MENTELMKRENYLECLCCSEKPFVCLETATVFVGTSSDNQNDINSIAVVLMNEVKEEVKNFQYASWTHYICLM